MKDLLGKITAAFLAVVMCFSALTFVSADTDVKAAGETFIIDPGHGGSDPGAVLGSRHEADDVLRLGLRVGQLVSPYATVAYTRTTDVYISLQQRCDIANAGGHKYFISLHRNSAASSTATGCETYYMTGGTTASANMAKAVNDRIAAAVPWRNRGVKTAKYKVITGTNMTSCLAEVGFICNPSDNTLFDQYFEQIALAIGNGMLSMIGKSIDGSASGSAGTTTVTNKLDGNAAVDMGQDFYARVKHISSGKYFTDDNGNVTTTDFTGGNEQVWHFMKQANGAYLVGNVQTRRFWDAENSVYADNTNIIANSSVTYGNNQKFFIYYVNNNFYFMPAGGDKTVDITASTGNVKLYGSTTGESATSEARLQRSMELEYLSVYTGAKTPADLGASFKATIKNLDSSKYVTANGSAPVCNTATGANNQEWIFTKQSNGSYTIVSASAGTALTVNNDSIASGTNSTLSVLTGGKNQKFFLISVDGSYYIKSSYSGNTLDMDATTSTLNFWGTGSEAIQIAAQKFEIAVVADPSETELVLKNESSLQKDGTDLYKVGENQSASSVLSNFSNTNAVVYDNSGNEVSANAVVGTGYTVDLIVNGEKVDSVTVIINGDVDGNGKIDTTDYLRIKGAFLGTYSMEAVSQKAADVDGTDKIDTTDYLRVKGHFLGSYNLFA